MSKVDVIVVGAGCAGLSSACTLKTKGYKVLLLDEHNSIGGLSNSITKGRFEFEPLFHALYFNENKDSLFSLKELFNTLGIEDKIEFSKVHSLGKVISKDENGENIEYKLPLGIDNYINSIEKYVPSSKESLKVFFDLALECREALRYIINTDKIDYDYIKQKYNNFYQIGNLTLKEVLDRINVPLKAQEILSSYWFYLGSFEHNVSFVQYAVLLYEVLNNGLMIPKNRNYDIIYALLNRYLELGGKIRYNSKVTNLILEDGKCVGVKLYDGTIYKAKKVIVNSNIKDVYNNLLDSSLVPSEALRAVNTRELGPSSLTVHLGLNRTVSELGLDSFTYLIYNSLDSLTEEKRMKKIISSNLLATVLNKANSDASVDGTCILSLSTLFFDECFENIIDQSNYYNITNGIASSLIDAFEKSTNIKIREYIEEIEIKTSLNTFGYINNSYANLYGFKLEGLDNLLPRLLNKDNEYYIPGLFICGGFNGDIYECDSAYYNGYKEALRAIDEMRGENK